MSKSKNEIPKLDINGLASELGYSYLDAECGYWKDGADRIRSYDSMDNNYLKNCINFIDKGIKELKGELVTNDIKNLIGKISNISTKEIKKSDIKYIKKELTNLLKEKKVEIKHYKQIRNL